ncbi:MAG: integration host factor subunit beta [Verrucomicrobia bacterium]|nr:MAG: integration host factor subunit beta [Verrucomicrobiota bacterium]
MANNLTKREIVLEIYEKTGFPQKQVQQTVQMALDIILNALAAGRNVELRNFGVFEVQVRKSRIGRNPNKPETDVIIPTRAVVKFKAGKVLKALIKDLDLDKLQAAKSEGGAAPIAPSQSAPSPESPGEGFGSSRG